jgi:hypothetical protein
MKPCTPWLLLFFLSLDAVQCWDNEELEIFDLVEEVNTNFYTLLGVSEVNVKIILGKNSTVV